MFPCSGCASGARCCPPCSAGVWSMRRCRSLGGGRSRPTIPGAIPAGPWLEWHYERFTTPPGAVEVARTADAVQAFRMGPHLGVQFHPESTVEIVAHWAEHGYGKSRWARHRGRKGASRRGAGDRGGRAGGRVPVVRRVFSSVREKSGKVAGEAGGKE